MGTQQTITSSSEIEYNLAILDQEIKLMLKYRSILGKQYASQMEILYGQYAQRMKAAQ